MTATRINAHMCVCGKQADTRSTQERFAMKGGGRLAARGGKAEGNAKVDYYEEKRGAGRMVCTVGGGGAGMV